MLVHLGTGVCQMKMNTGYDIIKRQLNDIAPMCLETSGVFDDPKVWEER